MGLTTGCSSPECGPPAFSAAPRAPRRSLARRTSSSSRRLKPPCSQASGPARGAGPWSRRAPRGQLGSGTSCGTSMPSRGGALDGSRASRPGAEPGACTPLVSVPPWDEISRLRACAPIGYGARTDQAWIRGESSSVLNGLRFLEWLQRGVQALHGRSSHRADRCQSRHANADPDAPGAHGRRVGR